MGAVAVSDRTVREALLWAAQRLRFEGIEDADREAYLMVAGLVGVEPARLPLLLDRGISRERLLMLEKWLCRRAAREPLQYILGYCEFWGIRFRVCRDVLIPRPETEHLVEQALALVDGAGSPLVCDLCTGSGCVAIAIASEHRGAEVLATDISARALKVAARNAEEAGVADRISFIEADLYYGLDAYRGRIDIITANPPYVDRKELGSLQPEVRLYEPAEALDGGSEGLELMGPLVRHAPLYLRHGGWLAVEIGYGQSEAVRGMFKEAGFVDIGVVKDYSGIDRVVYGRRQGLWT